MPARDHALGDAARAALGAAVRRALRHGAQGRSLLTTADIMREFREEFVLASPRPRVQSASSAYSRRSRALGKGAVFTR